MNFCENCDNLLEIIIQPGEGSEKSFLTFNCKCCDTTYSREQSKDLIKDNCIYNLNFNTDNIKIKTMVNKYTHEDITLPRVKNIKCPNSNCSSEDPEIIYIKYDNDAMKYIYVCCDCQKNGIEPSSWHLD
jgi:hypothetical protein